MGNSKTLRAAALMLLGGAASAQGRAEFLIHVSVDGLSGSLLEQNLAGDTTGLYANFQRLRDEGASTFQARTDYFRTNTLPNHTSMMTGRPVLQPSGQPDTVHHGWTSNSDPGVDQTLHNSGNPNVSYVASTFDVVHDHGLSTAMFASKTKFILYEQSYDADSGAPDLVGPDNGTDKIDLYAEESQIHGRFLTEMAAQHFTYSFLHYRDPDGAGHANGWGSLEWDAAVQQVDDWLGELMNLIDSDPVLSGRTTLILSADHGGTGTGHSTSDDVANYTVPFFAWGAGVLPGADLYALNVGRRVHPGSTNPTYGPTGQPIRNVDGGNLALSLLGLPAIPGSTINAAQDLLVGTPPELVAYGCGVNPTGSLSVLGGSPVPGLDLVLGIDDPTGSFPAGSIAFLILSRAPAAGYPCGPLGANLGLNGPGEVLVSLAAGVVIQPLFVGASWGGMGQPEPIVLSVPVDPTLVGMTFFTQGGLFDPGAPPSLRIGLTGAIAFTVGS